jgi:hypothetical protein
MAARRQLITPHLRCDWRPAERPPYRAAPYLSDRPDVDGLGPLLALFDLELHRLVLGEAAHSGGEAVDVDEDVLAAFLFDEAVALLAAESFDFACRQDALPLLGGLARGARCAADRASRCLPYSAEQGSLACRADVCRTPAHRSPRLYTHMCLRHDSARVPGPRPDQLAEPLRADPPRCPPADGMPAARAGCDDTCRWRRTPPA